MEEQLDLADVVATILAFHINQLAAQPNIHPGVMEKMSPDVRSAYLVWSRLLPYIKTSLPLEARIQALANSPDESTRRVVSDELRRLFETEYKLRTEIEDITRQSPYVVLLGGTTGLDTFSAIPDRLTRPNQSMTLIHLFVLVVITWGFAAIFTIRNFYWVLPFVFIGQGFLVGRYAKRLGIKQPFWLGLGAMLPGNIIYILLAMAGYRRMDDLPEGKQVYYSAFSKTLMKYVAAGILLLPVLLYMINASYMRKILEYEWGTGIVAVTLVAYALVLLALRIGFWRDKATTGIGIALTSTIAGWASVIVVGAVIWGPSFVKLTQMYPEAFGR